MFTNQRYATRGVAEQIPNYLQNLLWHLTDTMETAKKDHLQIFRLSDKNKKQCIIHDQEQPPYHQEYLIDSGGFSVVDGKVYLLDDGQRSTMLLAEEY